MSSQRLPLPGCAPIPLAHYLKALGVLRLVAEDQAHGDPAAAGFWERDVFVLQSRLDQAALVDFFLCRYAPTPILAPWNGGSGFYKKDNTEAIVAIEAATTERLKGYQMAIASVRKAMSGKVIKEKPSREQKEEFLRHCRSCFPDDALAWLDAAVLLTDEGAKFPPLLGTGGNDGRLEFTNNFMQRLTEVIDSATGGPLPLAERRLRQALFGGTVTVPMSQAPVGQFLPGTAGGANATSGFDSDSTVNPWDFILTLEGALLFAAAAVRRLEGAESGALSYPFCVRQASVGYASASAADETDARAEMWLPLWARPTGLAELRAVLSEGRAQVGARAARSGVDFARAVVSLGVDRGLNAFQRYGFQVRNGLSYFATPLDRVQVRRNACADLLSEPDPWLARLRDKAGPTAKQVPAAVARALRQVESSILDLCKHGSGPQVQAVLVALGAAERSLARSLAWTTGRKEKPPVQKCPPLTGLSSRWLSEVGETSIEFRLAASLASVNGLYKHKDGHTVFVPFRQHLEPIITQGNSEKHWLIWDDAPSSDVLWHEGDFVDFLNRLFARRLIRTEQAGKKELPDSGRPAALADVVAFIQGQTDDAVLSDLLWGLCLLDWTSIRDEDLPWLGTVCPSSQGRQGPPAETGQLPQPNSFAERQPASKPVEPATKVAPRAVPSALFSLLRLAFPRKGEGVLPMEVPIIPTIHRQAAAGRGCDASRLAVRRLRSSGFHPALEEVALTGDVVRRTAAALLFPVNLSDFAWLGQLIEKQSSDTK